MSARANGSALAAVGQLPGGRGGMGGRSAPAAPVANPIRRMISTAAVMSVYSRSCSITKMRIENATRATGVAMSSSNPAMTIA